MHQQDNKYSLPLQPFIWLAFLLLASGNILFFIGWFEPFVAMTGSFLLLGSIVYLMRRIAPSLAEQTLKLSGFDLIKLTVAALLLLLFVSTAGFIGYFPTDWDHSISRFAMYDNLTTAPWPVVLPNGKEFTYFIASLLPPAILARCVDEGLRQFVLLGYVYTFCLLIYILASFYLKKVSLLLLLLLCFLGDPVQEFGMRLYHYVIMGYFDVRNTTYEWFIGQESILEVAAVGKSMGPFNSGLLTMLTCCLILLIREARPFVIPLLIALLFPSSPLGAIAIMPIALYFYLPAIKKASSLLGYAACLIIPVLLVLLSVAYFLRGDSQITYLRFTWDVTGLGYFITLFARQLICTLILTVPLLFCKSLGGLRFFLPLPLLYSCIYFGCMPTDSIKYGINELFLKGVTCYNLLTCILWIKVWSELKYTRIILVICSLTGLVLYIKNHLVHFNPHQKPFDQWNGHLNHEHPFMERGFPDVKDDSVLSDIILKESGISEKTLPGSLLPKAPGCDYSRPYHGEEKERAATTTEE